MKIYIDKDERYPDFFITDDMALGKEAEVPDDFVQRYEDAMNEYEAIQVELEGYYIG